MISVETALIKGHTRNNPQRVGKLEETLTCIVQNMVNMDHTEIPDWDEIQILTNIGADIINT